MCPISILIAWVTASQYHSETIGQIQEASALPASRQQLSNLESVPSEQQINTSQPFCTCHLTSTLISPGTEWAIARRSAQLVYGEPLDNLDWFSPTKINAQRREQNKAKSILHTWLVGCISFHLVLFCFVLCSPRFVSSRFGSVFELPPCERTLALGCSRDPPTKSHSISGLTCTKAKVLMPDRLLNQHITTDTCY